MRRTVTVENGHGSDALVQYRTVRLTLDHAALVASKRSRADARDIRISRDGQMRPVHVRFPSTTATEVYWSLDADIPAGGSRTFTLHLGVLDEDEDRHPVPMRSKSQWDIEQAMPGYRTSGRNQPFAYYDGFQDAFDGQELSALTTAPGTPSGLLYDPTMVGSWQQTAIGAVTAASGSGNLSLTWRNFTHGGTVRVRGTMTIQAGFTTPAAGVICNGGSGALTGNTSGVGTTGNTGFLGVVTAGSFGATQSITLTRFVTDQTFAVEVAYDGKTLDGRVDGVRAPSTINTTTHAAETLAGVWTATTGPSGGVGFFEVWAEVWEGVDDSDVTVTVADLTATLPCPGLPGTAEELRRPAAVNPSDAFQAVRAEAVGPQDLPRYELAWPLMSADDFWELRALWYAQKGGAGTFSWTPPYGSEERYRFLKGSERWEHTSANGYAARVSVERVVQ